jgi:hypothetical protein
MDYLKDLVALVAIGAAIGLVAIIDTLHDKLRSKENRNE